MWFFRQNFNLREKRLQIMLQIIKLRIPIPDKISLATWVFLDWRLKFNSLMNCFDCIFEFKFIKHLKMQKLNSRGI